MLKKVIKLLLVFVLMMKIISPSVIANANEEIESTDIIDYLTDQLEIDLAENTADEIEDITPEVEVEETEVDLTENIADEIDDEGVDVEDEREELTVVWTPEELTFFDQLWNRFYEACNEAWDLFFYVEAMDATGTLTAHPNGAELYQLLNTFNEGVGALATGTWIDMTLPFEHELNVAYLAKMDTFIEFFEYFVARVTTALDVVVLEIEAGDSDNNTSDTDGSDNDDDGDNDESNDHINNTDNNSNDTLPQTGTDVALNTMLAGSGLAAVGGVFAYRKLKKD